MTINIAYLANIQSQVRCHHTLIMTLTHEGMIINIGNIGLALDAMLNWIEDKR